MPNKQSYTRKKVISFHGIYIGSLFLNTDMDTINLFESRIHSLQKISGKPEIDILYAAVVAGLPIVEQALNEDHRLDRPPIDSEKYTDWVIWKANQELFVSETKLNKLIDIYEKYGEDKFIKWADDNKIDVTDFLEQKGRLMTQPKQAEIDRQFLERLLADKGIVSKEDLVKAAIEENIIYTDEDGELVGWNRLDRNAERAGYKCKNPRAHYASPEYVISTLKQTNIPL